MDLALRSSELGKYQLGRVGHSHVEQWVKRMADQRLAAGTIKTRYKTSAASSVPQSVPPDR